MGMYLAMHGPLDGAGIPRALFVVSSDISGMHLRGSETFFLGCVCSFDGDPDSGTAAAIFGFFAFRSRIRGVYFSILTQAATVALWLLFCRNDLQLCGTNGLNQFYSSIRPRSP